MHLKHLKLTVLLVATLVIVQFTCKAQTTNDPVYFIDSVKVSKTALEGYQPNDFASFTVYKGANAVKLVGAEGKEGVIYIETKRFVRLRYWKYLCSKSAEYKIVVPNPNDESAVAYILNKRVLTDGHEVTLSGITDKVFRSITIINKKQVVKDYNVTNREYGVVIVTDTSAAKQ